MSEEHHETHDGSTPGCSFILGAVLLIAAGISLDSHSVGTAAAEALVAVLLFVIFFLQVKNVMKD